MAESCVPLPVVSNSGGYQAEFVDSIPDTLSCSICFLPLRDPHLVSCCGAKFCEPCIGRVKAAGQPCPLCKQEFVSLLDRSFQRKVLELNVCCPGKKDGCQWVGELRHVVTHERDECGWAVVGCSYQCGAHLPRRLMAEHEHDMCPQRPMDVKLESLTKKMEERHEREIKKMETILKTERERHEKEMKKMETRLMTEREQHEREMKKLETNMTALETRLMTEREQHEKEMEKMRTRLTTESERHKREIETKLSTEREHHDSEMKKMETKLTAIIMTKLATEREQNEKEMAAVREKKEVCSKNGLLNQEHMHEAERSTSETILIIQAVL